MTYSKMFDRLFQYGQRWVEKEQEWPRRYPTLDFDNLLIEMFTNDKIDKVIKKYDVEEFTREAEKLLKLKAGTLSPEGQDPKNPP